VGYLEAAQLEKALPLRTKLLEERRAASTKNESGGD
jgi:hypothetical protein